MATPAFILCPSCQKKFKGKPELAGKKIKCPACSNPFVVPAEEQAAPRAAAKPQPAATLAADDEANPNPYGMTYVDLAARCPNCANKMESEDAIICLFCGYNTQTRGLGNTKLLLEHTLVERLVWLSPGIGAALAIFLLLVGQLYFCTNLEDQTRKSWLNFLNHESMRLWGAFIQLAAIWVLGIFVVRRLILHPTPPEKEMK